MPKPEDVIYSGLAQVAHAIRRSTALYIGMNMTPANSTIEEMEANAEHWAAWLRGSAKEPESKAPLGQSFSEVVGGGGGYSEPDPVCRCGTEFSAHDTVDPPHMFVAQ
jgi:hypothetical protein